jgi:ATP-dependent Lhr-like helicase
VAQAAGRWSTVVALLDPAPSPTEMAHARALTLLERYGIISREAIAAERLAGGFAAFSPVLRALEDAGKIRRGHFVEGLTGAQFAHAGAVDRLRAARDPEPGQEVLALAAVDPANPYGALLPWPGAGDAGRDDDAASDTAAPRRTAGARIVLVYGEPVLYVERGGRRLRIFPAPAGMSDGSPLASSDGAIDADTLAAAVAALRDAGRGRRRPLRIERVNGVPALRSTMADELRRAGFRMEPGALVLDPLDGTGSLGPGAPKPEP